MSEPAFPKKRLPHILYRYPIPTDKAKRYSFCGLGLPLTNGKCVPKRYYSTRLNMKLRR